MRMELTREQGLAHRLLASLGMTQERMGSCLAALERAESMRSSITASIDGMELSGSSQGDRMLSALVRMDESIDEIGELSGSLAEQFREVEAFVTEAQRADEMAGRALRLVYVDGATAKEAADGMGCSPKTVYEHLRRGLDMVYGMI